MRKLVIVCILLAVAFVINMGTISNAYASTKSDKKIVKAYVNKVYPKHKIKYCKYPPRNRKSKNKVYVEILRTQSEGTGGYSNEGSTVSPTPSLVSLLVSQTTDIVGGSEVAHSLHKVEKSEKSA